MALMWLVATLPSCVMPMGIRIKVSGLKSLPHSSLPSQVARCARDQSVLEAGVLRPLKRP
jgi:hypothetical protein